MNSQLSTFFEPVQKIFSKHHFIIFAVISSVALGAAVYSLYDAIQASSAVTDTSLNSTIQGFDQDTIDSIKKLHDSSDTTQSLTLPSPRPNPFVE